MRGWMRSDSTRRSGHDASAPCKQPLVAQKNRATDFSHVFLECTDDAGCHDFEIRSTEASYEDSALLLMIENHKL